MFEKWILGCQETHWSAIRSRNCIPMLRRNCWAGFRRSGSCEPRRNPHASGTDFRRLAGERRCSEALHETLSQARSNGRGVTGLRRVLRSLEMGEVQTLLIGENYLAQAVECSGCGHLDAHLVSYCPVCGRETREVVDVAEAILPWVIRRDIEVFYVKDDPEFDKVGNIAALLRFRSAQKTITFGRSADLARTYPLAASPDWSAVTVDGQRLIRPLRDAP